MSSHKNIEASLTVDQLSQDASSRLQKVIATFRESADELTRQGYIISIRHHGQEQSTPKRKPGRPAKNATPEMAMDDDLANSKNKGSTLYWKDVRRLAAERNISPSDARKIIRERQNRRRPSSRKSAELATS